MAKSFRKRINNTVYFTLFFCMLTISACSFRSAQKTLLTAAPLKGAHVGIAVYNASSKQWVDKYQSDHYFTPASNTKIQTCYLGMKYLKDSLPGWQFAENKDSIFLMPLGDPSFLHPDFTYQPVADLIRSSKKQIVLCLPNEADQFEMYGRGWSWDDYAEAYQPERNRLNIYGNVMTVEKKKEAVTVWPKYFLKGQSFPNEYTIWSREKLSNQFYPLPESSKAPHQKLPFITDNQFTLAKALMEDSLAPALPIVIQKGWHQKESKVIATVPTDSLLKIMMYKSDNFYAEQVLLMTSQQLLGRMDDAALIDTVLKTDFASFPQISKWVDGSGLSRFNLTTPENYIALLKQMQTKFGEARVRNIFEKGGEGTLSAYYKNFPGEIYAKTGTLGGQIALSGFMYTPKKQKWYFSVLVANHVSKTTMPVRKAVEAYLTEMAKRN